MQCTEGLYFSGFPKVLVCVMWEVVYLFLMLEIKSTCLQMSS